MDTTLPAATEAPAQPPASEPTSPATAEPMIPKSRLDEVIKQREKAEKDLQKFLDAEEKRKMAEMTELQKAQALVEKANKDIETFRAEADKARLEANAKLLKSAVLLKAAAMGFEHPADAFTLADLSAVNADDKGEYDEKLIEAALKPLTGRLPVKAQGAGQGTPKLPPKSSNPTRPDNLDEKRAGYRPL